MENKKIILMYREKVQMTIDSYYDKFLLEIGDKSSKNVFAFLLSIQQDLSHDLTSELMQILHNHGNVYQLMILRDIAHNMTHDFSLKVQSHINNKIY